MPLPAELYVEQASRWPSKGKHILAHYAAETIVVYQAYRPSIGEYASKNGAFGGDFSYSRMSWIKPNFLWMMFRCGWGTKEGQEIILGLRLRRPFFDSPCSRDCFKLGSIRSSHQRRMESRSRQFRRATAVGSRS
jgi:hypothetical protein